MWPCRAATLAGLNVYTENNSMLYRAAATEREIFAVTGLGFGLEPETGAGTLVNSKKKRCFLVGSLYRSSFLPFLLGVAISPGCGG